MQHTADAIQPRPAHNAGFSLVELSIVLVILGLLTGGILAGQNLIRAAELRSITTDFDRIQTATNTFRDKYFALPGDMRNAEDFWGVEVAADATCKTQASDTPDTCNGDGDGVIDDSVASQEEFRAWQHLANAGLIEGTYSGIDSGDPIALGDDVMRSKMNNGGWSFVDGVNPPQLAFGTRGNDITDGGIIAASEAWNIDTKMDDGAPRTGIVQDINAVAACSSATDYDVDDSGGAQTCALSMNLR